MSVAEPIAHAMSALHRIEASRGGRGGRGWPGGAQRVAACAGYTASERGPAPPAVDQALEAIAGSLSLIHQLGANRRREPPACLALRGHDGGAKTRHLRSIRDPRRSTPAALRRSLLQRRPFQTAPRKRGHRWPTRNRPPRKCGSRSQGPPPAQPAAAPPPFSANLLPRRRRLPSRPAQAAAPPAPPGSLRIEAELGAHSGTNFYKGLSGKRRHRFGRHLRRNISNSRNRSPRSSLRVSMARRLRIRGHRHRALDARGSELRFGRLARLRRAVLPQITPEGRQLVYRYVRNREPLFHDDL